MTTLFSTYKVTAPPKLADVAIGVDPGIKGAFAEIDLRTGIVTCFDIPVRTVRGKAGKTTYILDYDGLADLCQRWAGKTAIATVENPSSFRQGSVSSATFSANISACIMGLACVGVPRLLVAPSSWKKAMGLTSVKSQSVTLAGALFPHADIGTNGTADRAEALLLAWYGTQLAPGRFIEFERAA